jgi:shikimate dehydrogenase
VVSTVVSGAADSIAAAVARSAPLIVDIIYDPWPTVLASAAERAGCTVVSGLDLLIGQALQQIELMTGRAVAADVLYAALKSERINRQRVQDC